MEILRRDCIRCQNKKDCHDVLAPIAYEVRLLMWKRIFGIVLRDYRMSRQFGITDQNTIEELYGDLNND